MKKFLVPFIVIFCLLAACSQNAPVQRTAPLAEASPESVGVSFDRLARIDSMCVQAVREGEVPGIAALVARNGKIVYYKAFGMADNQSGRELKRDDIFRIASQTKAITATAVMMLWEEGLFRLDDPISKYIPEFKDAQVLESFDPRDTSYTTIPAVRPITIGHLLTHTSGLGYGIIDGDERFRMIYQKASIVEAFTTRDLTNKDNIINLASLPLHHQPGERYTYCMGLDVLGYLVEILSGMPFDEFLRTRLFDPLGMDDTWFYLPEQLQERLVTVQTREDGKWVPFPNSFYDPDYPIKGAKTLFPGGGGLSSTAIDYATFLQMYLNDGELNGTRILSRTTVNTIMSNHFTDIWEDTYNYYGLAFSVITEKGEDRGGQGSTGTFGWGGYFNTQYFADPGEEIIGIIFKQTQGTSGDNTGWKFRQLVGQVIDD